MIGSQLVDRIVPSPNWRERGSAELKYIIIHGTWMSSDAEAIARLRDPAAEVSAHYLITREGDLVQMVSEAKSAWHAGVSAWDAIEDLNDWSIGIELGNSGSEAYAEAQYQTLIALLKDILARYPAITPANVLGHSDIAPGRKDDPGEHFEWDRLVSAGVCARPRTS